MPADGRRYGARGLGGGLVPLPEGDVSDVGVVAGVVGGVVVGVLVAVTGGAVWVMVGVVVTIDGVTVWVTVGVGCG